MMAAHRFVIALGSTLSRWHRSAQSITVDSLAEAEQRAQEWLRQRRLKVPGGPVWDRWSVGHTAPGTNLPKIVAHGTVTGVTASDRDHGWVD